MNLNISYDSNTLNNAPAAFFSAVNYVRDLFDGLFTNNVTVNVELGYGRFPLDNSIVPALGESEQNHVISVGFLFDLLFVDGENLMGLPLVDRKARLVKVLANSPDVLRYNDHQIGQGPAFHRLACQHGLEGIVSKRANGRYEPDRRSWLKTKCLNREEFVVVGWSDPEGSRHRIGALLLGYHAPDGKLIYAGRAGTGITVAELERLWQRLKPLAVEKMPLSVPPPRGSRFGSSLVLSRVHWLRPEMVAEVSYAEWTPDGLLRHVVYLGEREDKPARDVRRDPPPP